MKENAPDAEEVEDTEYKARNLQSFDIPVSFDDTGLRRGNSNINYQTGTLRGVNNGVAAINGLGLPAGVSYYEGRYWRRNQVGIMVEVLPQNNYVIATSLPQAVIPTDCIYTNGMLLKRASATTFVVNTIPTYGCPRVAISTSTKSYTELDNEEEE